MSRNFMKFAFSGIFVISLLVIQNATAEGNKTEGMKENF